MIDLIAAAGIGGIIGFGTCAVFTAGKVGDLQSQIGHTYREALTFCKAIYSVHYHSKAPNWKPLDTLDGVMSQLDNMVAGVSAKLTEANDAHTRCSDALEASRNRIERALAVETPKAAHGVKKMARLLRGEQG